MWSLVFRMAKNYFIKGKIYFGTYSLETARWVCNVLNIRMVWVNDINLSSAKKSNKFAKCIKFWTNWMQQNYLKSNILTHCVLGPSIMDESYILYTQPTKINRSENNGSYFRKLKYIYTEVNQYSITCKCLERLLNVIKVFSFYQK